MKMKFNDFYWHDAVIKNIQIDRNNPGILDTIIFDINWSVNKGKSKITFEDVYWASFNLNFGIVANETILNAFELEENDETINRIYTTWNGKINDVKLKGFKFSLNSTGSEIIIISKRFRVDEL